MAGIEWCRPTLAIAVEVSDVEVYTSTMVC